MGADATVEVETLDRLIAHMVDHFVKVDVEDFEEQVVLGLFQTSGTLLNTHTEVPAKHFAVSILMLSIGPCQFQVSYGETMQFKLPNWVSADEIRS